MIDSIINDWNSLTTTGKVITILGLIVIYLLMRWNNDQDN
jgi:flagellar biogenesis protein FliO